MIPGQLIAPGQLTDPVVQHRVTRLAVVTFLHVNRTQKLPGARVVLRMLIINVCNKSPKKSYRKHQK